MVPPEVLKAQSGNWSAPAGLPVADIRTSNMNLRQLLQDDFGTDFFQFGLNFLCFLFRHPLLDRLRRTFD